MGKNQRTDSGIQMPEVRKNLRPDQQSELPPRGCRKEKTQGGDMPKVIWKCKCGRIKRYMNWVFFEEVKEVLRGQTYETREKTCPSCEAWKKLDSGRAKD